MPATDVASQPVVIFLSLVISMTVFSFYSTDMSLGCSSVKKPHFNCYTDNSDRLALTRLQHTH